MINQAIRFEKKIIFHYYQIKDGFNAVRLHSLVKQGSNLFYIIEFWVRIILRMTYFYFFIIY
jgi:hypothetical protein